MKQVYHFLLILFIICFTTNLYSQSVPSYVPTNGLIGWWGFNGNAQDGSGNGNHGTVNGATLTTDRFGNQNGAYSFDGTDFIVVNYNSSLNLPNSSFNLWFKTTQNSRMSLLSKANFSNATNETHAIMLGYLFSVNGPTGIVYGSKYNSNCTPGVGWVAPINNLNITDNSFHMLTCVTDSFELRVFVDGILQSSCPTPSISSDVCPNSDIRFGVNWVGDPSYFSGKLDDIGIWNRALTQQEITNLYNSQLPTQTSLCLPSITTNTPNSIGIDSVIVGGNITNDGGSSIVLRGVCYSTTPNPNMGNMRTEDGSGVGSFSTILRNLNPSTTYYVRSYAKNTNGVVVYGNEVSFSTYTSNGFSSCGGVTDVDGNSYQTVQIGTQCWTQSNLKVSRFRNGDSILTGFSNSDWYNLFYTPAYSIYNNDAQNEIIFGKLYNHVSVRDSREICPTGWHVPTDTEWNVLIKFLDSGADTSCNNCVQSPIAGGALKSTSIFPIQSGWMSPNTGATNSSGFFGTPGGMRDGHTGTFNDLGNVAFWWTSSTSHAGHPARVVLHNGANVNKGGNFHGLYGFSVRCLRD
jgi:uncharacterized protein (TIGR02145 family)